MENQLSRIASFIDSLSADNVIGNETSFLLSTDMNAIGGDNAKNCTNSTLESCQNVKNGGDCKNYNNTCGHSDNKGDCQNTGFEPSNPKPINISLSCN